MPSRPESGQPPVVFRPWFDTAPGRALLESEHAAALHELEVQPALPWLWIAPVAQDASGVPGRGLCLHATPLGLNGAIRCSLPLPLPNETFGCIVLQHVLGDAAHSGAVLSECERLLAPGGRLALFALNPLAPYRLRWRGTELQALEPLTWRRRLRRAGLTPAPVSQGIGPNWQVQPSARLQDGPGLRAAYLLRADKRRIPLTPQRSPLLQFDAGMPAA